MLKSPTACLCCGSKRLRWARGNVQITQVFWSLWFNRRQHLAGPRRRWALVVSIFLMPVFQITGALGLVVLYGVDESLSWTLFRSFWIVAALVYLFVTAVPLAIDWGIRVQVVGEGAVVPVRFRCRSSSTSLLPSLFDPLLEVVLADHDGLRRAGIVFVYLWLALSMLVSYTAMVVEKATALGLAGAGSAVARRLWFLVVCRDAGRLRQRAVGASRSWDKTVKTGKGARDDAPL